jgi:hypothetical protein
VAKGYKTGGRKPGSINKVTQEFRQTVQSLLDANQQNVAKWLTVVAKDDPAKALDLIAKLAEYAAPKLARTEHTGEGGGAVKFQVEAPWLTSPIASRN